ncbi:alanine racemase [Geodermatophilus ruber]|uniref:Alanine racemase n=1 Tax=Geodermatophilus ruber TaxID=504800 RepID=A0A1I4EUV3_9ACTN|nr:alanine racemase [Geodermatophilus ruber]SFL09515.1 alanine racemase [Geodermatophilus ruber]
MTAITARPSAGTRPCTASAAPPLAEVEVDLGAIAHNAGVLRRIAGVPVMAVVKADAFGHGAVPVARAALAGGATWLGVATLAEALHLRADGIDAPVLTWLYGADEDVLPAVQTGVALSVPSLPHLHAVARAAAAAGVPAVIHLKVDTGLHRNGCSPADWLGLVRTAAQYAARGTVVVEGIWSHLAAADHPDDPLVDTQLGVFQWAVDLAGAEGVQASLRHMANSAAALHAPWTRFDLVRAGLGLYGVEPVPGRVSGLRPAMTFRARAVLAKSVRRGAGVSYGHEYRAPQDGRLLLVPVGYADGVPTTTSHRAEVWIGGRRARVAGRVAMDQFVVDLADGPGQVGDEVVLFGPGTRGEPTAAEWAAWAGCPVQQVFTGLGRRVVRRYTRAAQR